MEEKLKRKERKERKGGAFEGKEKKRRKVVLGELPGKITMSLVGFYFLKVPFLSLTIYELCFVIQPVY